jgi:hypothetical protein
VGSGRARGGAGARGPSTGSGPASARSRPPGAADGGRLRRASAANRPGGAASASGTAPRDKLYSSRARRPDSTRRGRLPLHHDPLAGEGLPGRGAAIDPSLRRRTSSSAPSSPRIAVSRPSKGRQPSSRGRPRRRRSRRPGRGRPVASTGLRALEPRPGDVKPCWFSRNRPQPVVDASASHLDGELSQIQLGSGRAPARLGSLSRCTGPLTAPRGRRGDQDETSVERRERSGAFR